MMETDHHSAPLVLQDPLKSRSSGRNTSPKMPNSHTTQPHSMVVPTTVHSLTLELLLVVWPPVPMVSRPPKKWPVLAALQALFTTQTTTLLRIFSRTPTWERGFRSQRESRTLLLLMPEVGRLSLLSLLRQRGILRREEDLTSSTERVENGSSRWLVLGPENSIMC